jgi:hypothetical protein
MAQIRLSAMPVLKRSCRVQEHEEAFDFVISRCYDKKNEMLAVMGRE